METSTTANKGELRTGSYEEKRNQFIDVFNQIGLDAFGDNGYNKEARAEDVAVIISQGLFALGEFGNRLDESAVSTIRKIREKFKNDPIEDVINSFLDSVLFIIISANRNVWNFSPIANVIEALVQEQECNLPKIRKETAIKSQL
jgi:hypothetical protein